MEGRKVGNFVGQVAGLDDVLKKKRPDLTRLDIEKLFEESIELTEIHRKLADQNQRLKKDLQKVQQAKTQRQQFISQVQRIVKQKSHELSLKNPHQSSWIVSKLQQKIFILKQEIEMKDKSIRKLNLSNENQILFKKQIEIECLEEINNFAMEKGIITINGDNQLQQNLEEIVWMDDYLEIQKEKIQELESQLEEEERETQRLLATIGIKKAEIKRMKEVQKEYLTVQQSFLQQRKKKQQKSNQNKNFITGLMKQRQRQVQKLENLKQKRAMIDLEQSAEINKMQEKIKFLENFYEKNKGNIENIKLKSDVCIKSESKERWVKRVSVGEVEMIAKNLNLCLALRGVNQSKWISYFFSDNKPVYSIENVIEKLGAYPFEMTQQNQKSLLARYVVQDNDTGLMLQDLHTSQKSAIIRSILLKLIGPIRVYSQNQYESLRQQIGSTLNKYWSLVEQSVHIREGVRNQITRQMLLQGISQAGLELSQDQGNFIVLFLFSWVRDINRLELSKLGKLKELGFFGVCFYG